MSLFDMLRDWIKRDRKDLVTRTFEGTNAAPVAGRDYIRITLSRGFLGKESSWFSTLQPLVQSVVQLRAGDSTIELPAVFDATKLAGQSVGDGETLVRNLRLTPLVPFRGGDVTVQVGLVSVPEDKTLKVVAKILGDVAGALGQATLQGALAWAPVVLGGIAGLAGLSGPKLQLGYVDTLDATAFKDSSFALVRADPKDVPPDSLSIVDNTLHVPDGKKATKLLTGVDWLLVRFEVRDTRDDWASLSVIARPWNEARAAAATRDVKRARCALASSIRAAFESADLTDAHRTLIIENMRATIDADLATEGARSGPALRKDDLASLADNGDLDEAATRPIPTLAEALKDLP